MNLALVVAVAVGWRGVKSPTLPAEPETPKISQKESTSTNLTESTNKTERYEKTLELEKWEKPETPLKTLEQEKEKGYKVKFKLESGAEIIGWINPETNSFMVINEKGGVKFRREVDFGEVKHIRFKKWKPFASGGNASDGFLYMFSPSELEVELKDGTVLKVIERVSELMKFNIFSNYGKTTLFSYFGDYWIQSRRGYFFWKNSGISEPAYPTTHPHPKTVVEMEFLE